MRKKLLFAARKFGLTARESEVSGLLLAAKSPKEIASDLGVSIYTVNFHKRGIFRKLKVNLLGGFFLRIYLQR